MKPKVFVTRKIPEKGLELLKRKCEVRVYQGRKVISRKELINGVKWGDALLCMLTEKINKKLIDVNPHLKVISNYAVGFDNIDVKYAAEKGIPVTNTPGKFISRAVAEHTFALIMAITKRIVEADQYTRSGRYEHWEPLLLLGSELSGKKIGIIGLGRIGSGVAERAKGLGLEVIYYDLKKDVQFEKQFKAKKTSLHEILKNADIVTLHVPLLPSTRHLIGEKELAMMKETAYLINTSRGPVIDEKALVKALKQKRIAGAALDVYEHEPELTEGLKRLSNVVLTPHIASATIEAREAMAKIAAENILITLAGKKPKNQVN